jgi:hypothetical protein
MPVLLDLRIKRVGSCDHRQQHHLVAPLFSRERCGFCFAHLTLRKMTGWLPRGASRSYVCIVWHALAIPQGFETASMPCPYKVGYSNCQQISPICMNETVTPDPGSPSGAGFDLGSRLCIPACAGITECRGGACPAPAAGAQQAAPPPGGNVTSYCELVQALYFSFFFSSKALRIFSGVTGSSLKLTPMAS